MQQRILSLVVNLEAPELENALRWKVLPRTS